jgi:hypothetical protein
VPLHTSSIPGLYAEQKSWVIGKPDKTLFPPNDALGGFDAAGGFPHGNDEALQTWKARPFHPKLRGMKAIKDIVIA